MGNKRQEIITRYRELADDLIGANVLKAMGEPTVGMITLGMELTRELDQEEGEQIRGYLSRNIARVHEDDPSWPKWYRDLTFDQKVAYYCEEAIRRATDTVLYRNNMREHYGTFREYFRHATKAGNAPDLNEVQRYMASFTRPYETVPGLILPPGMAPMLRIKRFATRFARSIKLAR